MNRRRVPVRLLLALLSGPAALAAAWVTVAASQSAGLVVLPDSAPKFSGPQGREGDITEIIATRDQTGGSVGLFRQSIAPKSGPPAHVHRTEDEFIYIVSGEFRARVGERLVNAPARTVLFVPRGTTHTFQNIGAEPGVLLVGVTPGGFERMFQERQGVDAATNQSLMGKHNMAVVGPPLQ